MKFTNLLLLCLILGASSLYAQKKETIRLKRTDISSVEGKSAHMDIVRAGVRVILVADHSGSMEDNDKIEELNDALQVFFQGLAQDDLLSESIDLGIIGFESHAQITRSPQKIAANSTAPYFDADGGTNMDEALDMAYNLASAVPQDQLKPIVILITDGEPDHHSPTVSAAMRLQNVAHFYALGVSGADFSFLQRISGNQQAAALRGTKFSQFFQDMSMDLSSYILSARAMGVSPKTFKVRNTHGWRDR
ncbi:MAG: vWA domain-containing protein [Flammeovirgaceae bacterium]